MTDTSNRFGPPVRPYGWEALPLSRRIDAALPPSSRAMEGAFLTLEDYGSLDLLLQDALQGDR